MMAGPRRPHGFYWQRGAAQQRTIDTLLQIIEGYEGSGRAGERITVAPRLDRLGLAPHASLPIAPPSPATWPQGAFPAQPMTPSPGWAHLAQDPATSAVVAVALFGLGPGPVRAAIEQISAQQGRGGTFVPVFFVDMASQAMFRRKGYMVEYFSMAGLGASPEPAAFRERFTLAWHKWGCSALIDLSVPHFLSPLIKGLGFAEARPPRDDADRDWGRPTPRLRPGPTPDVAALRAQYATSGLDAEPDSFVLYRIIGNDLYPRHERGQSLRNVRFILAHEPQLEGCERRWVLNRIIDSADEAAILDLLTAAGEQVLRLPFDWSAYERANWDFSSFPGPEIVFDGAMDAMSDRLRMRAEAALRRHKTLYAMNNNGARNAALEDGRGRAKWILPWDGNCFLTQAAWAEIRAAVRAQPYLKYFQVPMARLTDNAVLFEPGDMPVPADEPQVVFRRDAAERFDERFPYGRRPKVEFFWRMGVPGSWDLSRDDVWDLPRPRPSAEAGEVGRAGWVARLSSGMAELESDSRLSQTGREIARNEAIVATLDDLDQQVLRRHFDPGRLALYPDGDRAVPPPDGAVLEALRQAAEQALERGPYSVVDKRVRPPGGDIRDYWHPAPYWWPNPATLDGLPYIRRDGERVPGTLLFEPGSERYDRTRLQQMVDDTTVLALGSQQIGDVRYARHAARLVDAWFLDPATRMTPHLKYAQVRPGTEHEESRGFGIIEMKDLYYLLDAVRLIRRAGTLDEAGASAFGAWLGSYLDWLRTSPQGRAARRARNNHGTCHDLQVAAIAAYLDDGALLRTTLRASAARILDQFAPDGAQPLELARTLPLHYAVFNVQSWCNLARLAGGCGVDLWAVEGSEGTGLRRGIEWLVDALETAPGQFPDHESVDATRLWPVIEAYRSRFGMLPGKGTLAALSGEARPLYFPLYGIRPFWMLD